MPNSDSLAGVGRPPPYFLPRRLASFSANFPQIRVSIMEELTFEIIERLQKRVIDLALVALPIPDGPFSCQELLREPLYLVVPESHRLAARDSVRLREVEIDSFVLLEEGHCCCKAFLFQNKN